MVAVPSVRTWVDKEIPPVDTLNAALYDTWKWLLNPPMVKIRQAATPQSLANGAWTAITYGVEDIDTHGFHSTTTNPSRVTPTVPGWYVGSYGCSFAAGTTGRRIVGLRKNGGVSGGNPQWRTDQKAPTTGNFVCKGIAFGPVWMNGTTDYLEVVAYQTQGVSLNTDAGDSSTDYESQPEFYMRWYCA